MIRDGANDQLWDDLLTERDLAPRNKLAKRIASGLSREDVAALMVADCSAGGDNEKDASLRVLAQVGMIGRQVAAGGVRERWCRALTDVVKLHYPHNPLGAIAFRLLREDDKKAAGEMLVALVDLDKLDDASMAVVIRDLANIGTEKAISTLRAVAARGSASGTVATRVLEGIGIVRPGKVEELAAEWRQSRTPELLHRLHLLYSSRLDFGKATVREVKALLGAPDFEDSGMLAYAPSPGTALTLQKDGGGHIVGVHFA